MPQSTRAFSCRLSMWSEPPPSFVEGTKPSPEPSHSHLWLDLSVSGHSFCPTEAASLALDQAVSCSVPFGFTLYVEGWGWRRGLLSGRISRKTNSSYHRHNLLLAPGRCAVMYKEACLFGGESHGHVPFWPLWPLCISGFRKADTGPQGALWRHHSCHFYLGVVSTISLWLWGEILNLITAQAWSIFISLCHKSASLTVRVRLDSGVWEWFNLRCR